MIWSNGGTRVPLRTSICESVYRDGMNVNALGVPGPQALLDVSSTVFSGPKLQTTGGQR
jgi:hypothetical protein